MRQSGYYIRKDGKSKIHFFDNGEIRPLCGTSVAIRHKMKRLSATELNIRTMKPGKVIFSGTSPALCQRCAGMIGRADELVRTTSNWVSTLEGGD